LGIGLDRAGFVEFFFHTREQAGDWRGAATIEGLETELGRDIENAQGTSNTESWGAGCSSWSTLTFQVMRRTHSSLMNDLKVDPKIVADQLGHTLDVNQNVYTRSAISRSQEAIEKLEASLLM
jgi:hypothetical protein